MSFAERIQSLLRRSPAILSDPNPPPLASPPGKMPLKTYKTREHMFVPDIILEMESFPTGGAVPPYWWYRHEHTSRYHHIGGTDSLTGRPNTAPVPPYWWYRTEPTGRYHHFGGTGQIYKKMAWIHLTGPPGSIRVVAHHSWSKSSMPLSSDPKTFR